MNKEQSLAMIGAISNAPGASGFEDAAVDTIRGFTGGMGELYEDRMRNLYLRRAGNTGGRPVVQLDAHTDEVSFMVQALKPDGTLRFLQLGSWVDAALAGHRVLVRNALGEYIPGIIASTPPHYMTDEQRRAPLCSDTMTIDVGATSSEEAARVFGIRPGEPVVADVRFTYDDKRDIMIGKAFDCRLGCAAIIGTLDALRGDELGVDVVGAWATQEEMGMRGATVTVNRVKPDVAVCFEGCPADDTVAAPYMVQTAIKKGPMLRYIDGGMITHPRFQRFALNLAARLGIPAQAAVRSGGATDGAPIHLSNTGVPCIVIGLPVRYIHTHHGIASYADYVNAVRLGAEVVKALNSDVVDGF